MDNPIMDDNQIIKFVQPYTAVSVERIRNVLQLVETCVKERVEGDFIEIGVFKGGLIMAMALKCKQIGVNRKIHAYDTFTGMTEPTSVDVDLSGQRAKDILANVACICTLEDFQRNIALVSYDNIEIHIGDILKTEKDAIPKKIALLRLDTDWYKSTKFELTYFEPNVIPYGFVIVDDYGHWSGSKKAVQEFNPQYINQIDYTGIWWRKDYNKTDYGRNILLAAVNDHPECEFARVLLDNFHHFVNINSVLNGRIWRGCGSYLFDGQTYKYQRETLKKQEALYNVGKKCSNILEIGVYLGHSLLILLLSNPALKINCIDISNEFTPCVVDYLNKNFGNRIVFHLGTSSSVIPKLLSDGHKFDMIHIDGDHTNQAVDNDFKMSKQVALGNSYIVFDDYEAVKSLIDGYISDKKLVHIETPWCLWTNIITRLG